MFKKILQCIYNFIATLFGLPLWKDENKEEKDDSEEIKISEQTLYVFLNNHDIIRKENISNLKINKNKILIEDCKVNEATIDSDDRIEIKDSHKFPYSAIVNIQRIGYNCATGEFISPRTIITAAHVVYDRDNKKTFNLSLKPGINTYDEYKQNYSLDIKEIYIPQEYVEGSEATATDIAIIILNQDYDFGYFKLLSTANDDYYISKKVVNIGYPSDKQYISMWESHGEIIDYDRCIYHTADTAGGNSGSPLLSEDKTICYGVHNGYVPARELNVAAKINPGIYMWMKEKQFIK